MVTEYLKTIGIKTNQPVGRGFLYPYDVAFSSEGTIYALNRGSLGQRVGTRVQMFNFEEDWLGEFGEGRGTGPSNFMIPISMAFNSDDCLHITDQGAGEIKVFDSAGIPIRQIGNSEDQKINLTEPSGIAIDSEDNIYVTDQARNSVTKIDQEGSVEFTVGELGDGPGQFNMPWGLTVDSSGFIYIADWRNDRIQKLSPFGDFISSYGESGSGEGEFNRPSSVAVDSGGTIYVTDWGNERVQVLDSNGNFIQMLRGQATLSQWAEQWLDANQDELTARNRSNLKIDWLPVHLRSPYQVSAQTEHLFWGPVSAKIDKSDRLFVTEHSRARIQVYKVGK